MIDPIALPPDIERALIAWSAGCDCDPDRLCCPACNKRLDSALRRAVAAEIVDQSAECLDAYGDADNVQEIIDRLRARAAAIRKETT